MKKNVDVIIGVIFLVIFGLVVFLLPDTYNGKVAFNTEDEYREFKQVLAGENVTFKPENVVVVSSEPPIIVVFSGVNPHGQVFSYGHNALSSSSRLAFMAVATTIIGVVIILSRFSYSSDKGA